MQSTAASEAIPVPVIVPAAIPLPERIYWALRREFWESRWIYLVPATAGALFLVVFAIVAVAVPAHNIRAAAALEGIKQHDAIAEPYNVAAGFLMVTGMFVAAFYSVEALYGERRDRSVLFWKSLPVSDTITVLAKASIPLVLMWLIVFAITVITQLGMLLLSTAMLGGSGHNVALLWRQISFFRMSELLLYHLIFVHALSPAPLYAWLLLVSAWSRRAPFLWAVLPPVAIIYIEKLAFHSTHFLSFLYNRLSGGGMDSITMPGSFPMDPMTHLTPFKFVADPRLWVGFAVTAIFLAAAIRLRRYRGPAS